ncbi:MAG: FAD:protein FMN transferase, partial [Ruminococcus sp.]|nr:FAD:protein FMN transferase [Ruminococcus sp.]
MKLFKIPALMTGMLILLTGCGENPNTSSEKHERGIFAMDTYMNLTAYGDNAETALDKSSERIMELESIFSVTSENSDIWCINNSDGNPVDVSDDAAEIISKAIEYGSLTNGSLDITIYPVLKEWGFTTGDYKVPDNKTIESLLGNVDYNKIILNDITVSVPENYQIDLGSLAKGYTGDKVIAELKENGIKSAIISLGGNVQAIGLKPDGSKWKVSVRNPLSPDINMCIIEIDGKAVITSGNYERYFTANDGKNYCHIIDPSDGFPADNGLVSVTIIGESGIMCDALSTALFIMGNENAKDYWRKNGGFDMILVTDDGKITYTDGLADSLENISSMPAEVISRE